MSSNYNIVSLIRKKRDGFHLSSDEISYLIKAYLSGEIEDYQVSAFLMASFLNGLNTIESSALTESMLHSGQIVDLSHIPGIKVDKHSTGGVGDKLSLILAPIVASAGVPVPMISGRGLGHTGGTLDKLGSIPGFSTDMDLSRYKQIIEKHQLVLAGQTAEIAPADKKLYALRDVTATVEYIPFIASSIMSKKLAEGIDALVLDVKYGNGAFMKTQEQAIELAETLVGIGEQFKKKTIAFITNMNQPIGTKIGNWLEVEESIDCLKGAGPDDTNQLSHLLAGAMIYLGGKADSIEKGIERSKLQVENGEAFSKWKDIVEEQGGDVSYIDQPTKFVYPSFEFELKSLNSGYIQKIDTYGVGMAAVELGAGRKVITDTIDGGAGIVLRKKIGDKIEEGETILKAYTNKPSVIEEVTEQLYQAFSIGDEKPEEQPLVTHICDSNGTRAFEL
ncbi:MAG: thymidine phosphorylase [Balneolaceae bacterium]|nr:thymidine phosphorylase [Balneolaceae bacterium]